MDPAQAVLAEVAEILNDQASLQLERDLLLLLAQVSGLVAGYQDQPDTAENRATLQELYDRLAELAVVLEGEAV
jgi:hypothetical protein